MKSVLKSVLFLFPILVGGTLYASDTVYYELWDISNLGTIGGYIPAEYYF